jgi:hypothetical protein
MIITDARLDHIAREVCEAIGSNNGHGTIYAALREVRDLAHSGQAAIDQAEIANLIRFAEAAERYGHATEAWRKAADLLGIDQASPDEPKVGYYTGEEPPF